VPTASACGLGPMPILLQKLSDPVLTYGTSSRRFFLIVPRTRPFLELLPPSIVTARNQPLGDHHVTTVQRNECAPAPREMRPPLEK